MPKREKKPAPKLNEIGVTGLAEFSGQIQEDFLRELRGKEGYKRYREMLLNSPIVGVMMLAIEQAVRGVSWEFSSKEENDPRIDLLDESLESMSHSWNDHIVEVLTMLPYGYSIFEIVYKRDGARVLWRKFAIRGQDTIYRWLLEDNGGILGFEQQAPPTYKPMPIPIEKLVLYRTRLERNNPEGRSMLRTAWIPYYYAKHIQQIEAIGLERDLAGLPVITLPPGADVADTTASDLGVAKKTVRNIRNDEQAGIVMPDGWGLELLSTGGTRQFDTDIIIKRYESRMLMSALAQFLMLGQDGVGSMALSKDQTDFFTMSVNSVADIIAETFTKYAVPRLLKLNGLDDKGIKLEHTLAGDIDVNLLSDFLQKVGPMVTWSAEDEVWLRQVARLPDRDLELLKKERAEKEAQKQEKEQAFQDRFKDKDDNAATFYVADAPDDDLRREREREWQAVTQEYFDGAKRRLLKAAKEMKRANSD